MEISLKGSLTDNFLFLSYLYHKVSTTATLLSSFKEG